MPENITFRSHLLGSVSDFSEACNMGELTRPTILVELIVSVARYQEEGMKLCPEVYLCEDLKAILKMIPSSGELAIGKVDISESSVKEVLKKCAPLAVNGWKIYLESTGNFGLFRDSLNPLNVPVEETIISKDGKGAKVVRIYQISDDCVELRSYCGGYHNIYLSHKKESDPSPEKYIDDLVRVICENVNEQDKNTTETYFKKELKDGLRKSHGSLIAVVRGCKVPNLFSDGIKLLKPIDFSEIISVRKNEDFQPESLIAFGSILKGMLNTDGILVFSRDAKLLAYNCFVKSSKKQTGNPVGGARRRAYDLVCEKLNRGTYAAFIQSQDGWTDFRKVEND